jgi:hypothetical protein
MATLSTITSAIAARVPGTPNPISSEIDLWDLISGELFPVVSPDTQSLQSFTTKSNTAWSYDIKIKKQGNVCYLTGTATKNTGSTTAGLEVFTWKSNQYKPLSGINSQILKTQVFTGGNVGEFVFDDSGLNFFGTVVIGNTYQLPMITYFVPNN